MNEPNLTFKDKVVMGLLGLGLIVVLFSVTVVPAGTIRVLTRFGATTGKVMYPGLNFKMPFVESTEKLVTRQMVYETTPEDKQKESNADYKDYPVDTNTSDGNQVDVSYTISFHVDAEKAVEVVNKIGNLDALVEKIVKKFSRSDIRNIVRNYSAQDVYQGQGTQRIEEDIFSELQPKFAEAGLTIDSVGIREIKFSDEFVAKIEEKERSRIDVQIAEQRALAATHDKQADITKAEGQSEAQRLLRQDLTPDLVAKLWIEKWNGQMPVVTSDGNIIDLSSLGSLTNE